jgi:hypothetical protein
LEGFNNKQTEKLLLALAEELKLPFIRIAYKAELAELNGDLKSFSQIKDLSRDALNRIEQLLFGLRLSATQESLQLEPTTAGAVLVNAANELRALASQHSCRVEVTIKGKQSPIMTNQKGLVAVMTTLGSLFIESLSNTKGATITLLATKSNDFVTVGVFDKTNSLPTTLTKKTLESAKKLYGTSPQAAVSLSGGSGTALIATSSILEAMDTSLIVLKQNNLKGLGAKLPLSRQLSMI